MRALVAAAALVLLTPASVCAKDWLQFDRLHAHVGQRVAVESGWNAHPDGLVVYLVPLARSASFWRIPYTGGYAPNAGAPPRVRGAVKLGRAAAHGRAARLVFRVPRAGRFVVGVWCVPCNTHWTSALPNYQPTPYGVLRVSP
jgi:hypothetical protein